MGIPGTVVSFLSSGRLLLEPEEWQSAFMADIGGQIDAAVGCRLCGAVALAKNGQLYVNFSRRRSAEKSTHKVCSLVELHYRNQ